MFYSVLVASVYPIEGRQSLVVKFEHVFVSFRKYRKISVSLVIERELEIYLTLSSIKMLQPSIN